MPYHSTLKKQIQHFLDGNVPENEALKKFLESVNSTYNTFERDRKLTDHAFNISEIEYQKANQELQDEFQLRKESIIKFYCLTP